MSFYPEFRQQPSKPHQCIHVDEDGNRCGSHAMRNQYTCYHHQSEDMPSVFPNEAFPLDSVQDRAAIQIAIGDVLTRLAANTMDPKRATALLYGLQLAASNLPPHPRPARQPAAPAESQAHPEDDSPVPEREYTQEENDYFHQTVFTIGFIPKDHPRPASITDQDIIARTNNYRLSHHYRPPLKPVLDPSGALIALHQYPHQPDARITPPATVQSGCPVLAPLGREEETLTLHAAASTTVPWSLSPVLYSPISSFQTSGCSRIYPASSALHSAEPRSTTSTPFSRSQSIPPRKFSLSPTTSRLNPN